MATFTMSQIIGAIILIAIVLPWFLIPVVAVCFLYYLSGTSHFRNGTLSYIRTRSPLLPFIGTGAQGGVPSFNARLQWLIHVQHSDWMPFCGHRCIHTFQNRCPGLPPSGRTAPQRGL